MASPTAGSAPLAVTFNTSPPFSEAPSPTTWLFSRWDFGDGQTATDAQATHTYTAPGTYIASAYYASTFSMGFMTEDGGGGGSSVPTVLASATITVTTPRVIASLSLTPSTAAMLVGNTRTLALSDQNGNPVTGAAWMIDNTAVLSLSTDDPPTLTALNSGTATVTARFGNLSAQSAINVIAPGSNGGFPLGTVQWSVSPVAGFQTTQIIQVNSTDFSKPDLFSIETTPNSSDAIMRGLTIDGQQMWQAALGQYAAVPGYPVLGVFTSVPDALGGALTIAISDARTSIYASLVDVNGRTGSLAWRHDTVPFSGTLFPEFAVSGDGTIYIVEVLADAPGRNNATLYPDGSSHAFLLALDGKTGSLKSRIALPTGHYHLVAENFLYDDYDNAAQPGPVSVMPDGSVTVQTYTTTDSRINDDFSFDHTLYLTTLQPGGSAATVTLQHFTAQYSGCTSCQISYTGYGSGEVIPDGHGGRLVAWTKGDTGPNAGPPLTHVTHFDALGNSSDYTVPPLAMCWQLELGRGRNCVSKTSGIVLGENDTAFATDGTTLVAFDVNSGAMKWQPRQMPQNHQSALIAATAGGGAVAKDITFDSGNNNLGEQVVRFDATGAAAADAWAGTGLGYYAGDTWTGVPHGGTVAYSGKPFDNANTLWPDSEPFRCSCLFDIQVFNFSQTGPNQATIENELKAIQGLLDADPPLYPTCSAWLQGTMTGAQYIQFLFSANGYGANWIGHGDFRWELSDAFTGADKYTGPGILLTVNDVGGFFKKNDFFGDQISEGPKEYPGGDPRSQDLILVHEMAHGVEAAGFQPDLGKDTIEKANNKLVDKYCRQLIERKR